MERALFKISKGEKSIFDTYDEKLADINYFVT